MKNLIIKKIFQDFLKNKSLKIIEKPKFDCQ